MVRVTSLFISLQTMEGVYEAHGRLLPGLPVLMASLVQPLPYPCTAGDGGARCIVALHHRSSSLHQIC